MRGARFWVAVNCILAVMLALALWQSAQLASQGRELAEMESGLRRESTADGAGLKHLFFVKNEADRCAQGGGGKDYRPECEGDIEWHVDIHAEEAGDHCRNSHDDSNGGKELHYDV